MRGFRRPGRLRLEFRFLVSLVALVACIIALVVGLMDIRQRQAMIALNRERGLAIGNSLAAASSSALLSYNYVALQQLTQRAVQEEGLRYVIILDKEERVAGYSDRPEWQGKELLDPVSRAAVEASAPLVQVVPAETSRGWSSLDIAVPVFVEGSSERWGLIRVGLSLQQMYAELARTRLWVLGLGIGVLLVAMAASKLMSRHITRPLNRLVEATGELAKGNFDYRVGLHTGDEIEDLSRQFDTMAREIRQKQLEVQESNRQLAALNAQLEEKVLERTRALAEAEEKYRLLVEQSPNPICIIQDGRLVFLNQALAETFGYAADELTRPGFSVLELVDPSQHGLLRDLFRGCCAPADTVSSLEILGRHRQGQRIYLDMRCTAVSYDGRPALEAILVDITQQRELQDKIVSTERLRALGEMASGVAHDFNNVLGAILARAQLLERRATDEEMIRGLRIIEKAAQDGAEAVKRIQEFTRVRTDRDFHPVDITSVLEDVIEMTRSRWSDDAQRHGKHIRIERMLDPVPAVAGNISELREVFTNLILNAVDAISGEGRITVCTQVEQRRVIVSVGDTGVGMSPEIRRRLFDPFFTTKGEQGNGLGMSIVYGIVRRHEGEIEVLSQPGEGTVFRVTLPALEEGAAIAPAPTPPPEVEPAAGGRILVVDDEEDIRNLVAEILGGAGYEVTIAEGGRRAVERLREGAFDLVVSDLGMPDLSGWDVADEAVRLQPQVRLILLTGWGAALDPEEVERHRIDRTLKKPFAMRDLLGAVAEVLGSALERRAA